MSDAPKFDAPTADALKSFLQAMETHKHRRIWLPCAANMRVSAFLGLYRHLREGWSEKRAFELMYEIWQPDHVWSSFIRSQRDAPAFRQAT